MRVAGTIDGAPFRSSLMPRGGGALFIVVPQALRDRIQKSHGQSVEVSMEVESRPEVLRVPLDVQKALGPEKARFDRLAPSHRKAFLVWIADAKHAETRGRRIEQTVQMIRRGENRN
jgi:uncharacterized protein YdeI (YjbR/CyaY-like superfamily)